MMPGAHRLAGDPARSPCPLGVLAALGPCPHTPGSLSRGVPAPYRGSLFPCVPAPCGPSCLPWVLCCPRVPSTRGLCHPGSLLPWGNWPPTFTPRICDLLGVPAHSGGPCHPGNPCCPQHHCHPGVPATPGPLPLLRVPATPGSLPVSGAPVTLGPCLSWGSLGVPATLDAAQCPVLLKRVDTGGRWGGGGGGGVRMGF